MPGGSIARRREGSSGRIVKLGSTRFVASDDQNPAVQKQGCSVAHASRSHIAGRGERARSLRRRGCRADEKC